MSQSSEQITVPYHGAEKVLEAVRKIIYATKQGTLLPMSTQIMINTLVKDGMPEALAKKLPSQIRKGKPLFIEWKAAFISGRFVQKIGRSVKTDEPSPKVASKPVNRAISTPSPTKVYAAVGDVSQKEHFEQQIRSGNQPLFAHSTNHLPKFTNKKKRSHDDGMNSQASSDTDDYIDESDYLAPSNSSEYGVPSYQMYPSYPSTLRHDMNNYHYESKYPSFHENQQGYSIPIYENFHMAKNAFYSNQMSNSFLQENIRPSLVSTSSTDDEMEYPLQKKTKGIEDDEFAASVLLSLSN